MIRRLGETERPEAEALWRMCFPEDTEAFVRQYFDARLDMRNAVGVFEPDLRAILHMVPYTLHIRGKDVFAPYVVGAATHTAYRKQGLMGALLLRALEEMRAHGASLCPLYPFRYSFYRRYGWEAVSSRVRLDAKSEDITGATGVIVESDVDIVDSARMLSIYTAFCGRFGAYMARSERECALRLAETRLAGEGYALETADGAAYALCEIVDGVLTANELCYTHEAAMRALLGRLAAMEGVGRLRAWLPVCDALPAMLCDMPDALRLEPFLMTRVVDVAALLPGMRALWRDGDLCLRVRDGLLGWNDGVFAVETRGGQILSAKKVDARAQAEIGVEALGQWVCGFLDARRTVLNGHIRAEGAAKALLDYDEPVSGPYFQEMY